MIARIWTAHTTPENAPKYREHFETQVLPALRSVPGYAGAELFNSVASDEVEIVVTTRWQSLAAIRAFAGADPESAVVAEEVQPFFTQWDRRVRHYEVLVEENQPTRD
jgi:heme-degrading monooxygenase HmoA